MTNKLNAIFFGTMLAFVFMQTASAWPTTANPTTIYVGQTSNVSNAGPDFFSSASYYTFQWLQSNSGSGPFTQASSCAPDSVTGNYTPGSGKVNCIFTGTTVGTFYFELNATGVSTGSHYHHGGSTETEQSNVASVTVIARPAIGNVTVSPSNPVTIDVGQKITVTASPSGTPPTGGTYTYTWTVVGSCPGFTNPGNTNTFVYTPTAVTTNCQFSVTITDTNNDTPGTGTSGTITVNNPPSFGTPSIAIPNSIIDIGQSEVINANVIGGTAPYTFTWSENGNPVSSTGSEILFTGKVVGANVIRVTVTDAEGFTANAIGTVTVNSAFNNSDVTVTIPNSIISVGQSESITATVHGGTTPYTYVWTVNGKQISSTANSFIFSGNATTLASSPDSIQVTVKDNTGQTATASGSVTVKSSFGNSNVTVTVPNSIITVGQSETITATTNGGTGPFTYAWTVNGKTVGGNSASITFNGNATTLASSPDAVNVVVTDHNGQTGTAGAHVTVTAGVSFGSPSITIPNSIINVGQSEVITANVVGGTAPYTFVWKVNGNTLSSTSQSITFNGNTSDVRTDNIQVTVTDHNGQTASASGSVTVNKAVSFGTPSITIPNSIITVGQTETVAANVIGGTAPYTFVWKVNGATLSSTGQSITFNGNSSDIGNDLISVTVTDHNGQTASGSGQVTVISTISFGAPQITIPNSAIDVGQSESITANVMGGDTPYTNFVWTVNGNTLGVHTQTITFNGNTSDVGADAVHVTVTDSAGQIAVGTGTVTVNKAVSFGTPSVTIPNSILLVGQTETVTANIVGGTSPYSFVWKLNGNTLGQTTGAITFNGNVSDIGTDNIQVFVTDHNGETANAAGTVTVKTTFNSSSVYVTESNSIIEAPQITVFTAHIVGGTSTYTYQWTFNGKTLGSTTNTLVFNGNASTVGTDTVNVLVTDANSQKATAANTVTVRPQLVLTSFTISKTTIDTNQSDTLTATVSGGTAPYKYEYTVYNSTNTLVANAIYTGVASTTNTFTFQVLPKFGTGTFSADVNVIDSAPIPESVADPIIFHVNAYPGISVKPANTLISVGGAPFTFNITIINGTAPYTTTWAYMIPGANALSGNTLKASLTGKFANITVQAISDNTLKLTFNGVSYNIFAANALGTWTFNASAEDSKGVNFSTFNLPLVTVINGLGASITPASANVDVGQNVTFNATVVGGTGPYTYNWYFVNANTVSICANALTCTYAPTKAGNVIFKVTDSEPTTKTANAVVAVKIVGNTLSVTVTPRNATITANNAANVTFTANVIGGSGSFDYQWYNDSSGTPSAISGTNSLSISIPASFVGTFVYYIKVTDTNTMPLNNVTSNSATLTVQSSGGGCGSCGGGSGGSPGGGGGGGGGGLFLPTVSFGNSCATISNLTAHGNQVFKLDNTSFALTDNFVQPNMTGVTIGSNSYTLLVNKPVNLGKQNGYNFTLTLLSISYLPILHTATVQLCGTPVTNSTPLNVTILTNNTIVVTSGNPNNTVQVLVNGNVTSTGTGIATYSGLLLPPGNYIIQGKDKTTGQITAGTTYARTIQIAQLAFTKECADSVYNKSRSCTTAATVVSYDNKLTAQLYLNGNLIGNTTGTITDTESMPGNYTYVFETKGNRNYTANSITYNYQVTNAEVALTPTTPNSTLPLSTIIPILLALIAAVIIGYLAVGRRRKGGKGAVADEAGSGSVTKVGNNVTQVGGKANSAPAGAYDYSQVAMAAMPAATVGTVDGPIVQPGLSMGGTPNVMMNSAAVPEEAATVIPISADFFNAPNAVEEDPVLVERTRY